MTGKVRLDKIYVRFFHVKNDDRRFGGPGKMALTVHDAGKGSRRMTGTITGTKLEELDKPGGKFIDVTARFEADSSCGVK